jgi:hypothetical protein
MHFLQLLLAQTGLPTDLQQQSTVENKRASPFRS